MLGEWIQRSHQKWQWFYDEDAEALWEHDQSAWIEYRRMTPGQATRGSLRFTPIKVWTNREESGIPVSVKRSANTVHLLNKGPHFEETIQSPLAETFWEFVARQGGNWIWEYIEGKHKDMSWIASALYDGSAIMVTDGSYNRTLAPRISGAGWVLVSTNSLKMVYGAFYEVSSAASSYRGELLGLTAIHHLVAFVLEFYTTPTARGSIHCDNKGALHQAATNRKRVRPKTKHSDLIRNLRHIKATHKFEVCYLHVKAHLDDHLSWDQLSVVQQLNVHFDLLAKQAVQDYISQPIDRKPIHQLLPREQVAAIVAGEKLTSDTAAALRFALGTIEARRFFTRPINIKNQSNKGGLGWHGSKFDAIDWKTLERALAPKPMTYKVWLAKQTVGVCATRRIVARNQNLNDDRCPNCLISPERSTHLNVCLDEGRSLLFHEEVDDLEDWMVKNNKTDPELRYWLSKYLHFRGERTMRSLGSMSRAVSEVAEDIDMIGWTDLFHGRIPLSLTKFQQAYCASFNSRMTGTDWAKALVTKLLNISHGQWMYRNFSLHNKTKGHLRLTKQAEVLSEIATLATSRPEDIPPESRFLLEVEVITLDKQSLARQEYWISAMKAALKAGRRYSHSSRRSGSGYETPTTAQPELTPTQRRNLRLFQRRIEALERSLREDLDIELGSWRNKRHHPDSHDNSNGSNKRFRKPD